RLKRTPKIIGVEPCDDHALAEIRELRANVHNFFAKELRFVDANDFRARQNFFHYFGSFRHGFRLDTKTGMRNDFIGGIALVNRGLENLHALPGNFRAPQPANQLFALSRKHWPDHHFDPAHISFDDVHARSSLNYPAATARRYVPAL